MSQLPFKRILLVDDDPPFLQRLMRAMTDRGLEVEGAESAELAIEIAAEFAPEAAVLDLKLSGANGLTCLQQLKSSQPDLRVLMLTGYGSITTAMEAVRLGAWDYLTKPADADQILAALLRDPAKREISVETSPPSLERVEWEHIQRVLAENGGNISQTATALGLHRRSLQRKLQKYPPNS